ncbi:MAG TPA: XdhC family protein, partial [Gemmatimonadaceae bacterium]|nr:XdhC family protein [Gemmatimonadaceae bacterium]
MSTDIYATASRLRASGTPFVLATVVASWPPQSVRAGAKAIVHADGAVDGWVGGGCVRPVVVREAAEALGDGRPRLLRMNAGASAPSRHGDVREYPMTCQGEGGVEIYLEPVLAAPRLVVLGHTPVAQSLARLAEELGFEVVVAPSGGAADAAEPFAATVRVAPDAPAALAGAGASTWVVVATMGAGDEEALAAAAASEAAYVGLVASRKKGRWLVDYARASGVPAERLARVKFPAGLDLGGSSAAEIATAIMAEIIALRHAPRGADAASRRERAPAAAPLPVDPVCGMPVDPAGARHTLVVGGETLYFCCPHCKASYERSRP